MIAPKKLIESALPLDDINREAAREKSILHGHPSTLHLWWARRPLAAARAVLFAQLVNAPKTKKRKEELFDLIRELVKWENSGDKELLARARKEILASWRETCALNGNDASKGFDPHRLPAFHDPFAGGGAIPLEAQRLGLESWASDLNPVAVTINKAMIEIPPRFIERPPVGPGEHHGNCPDALQTWPGSSGLAEDVKRYGLWMNEEAKKRIGQFYPSVEVTESMAAERPDLRSFVGHKFPVIAWLWARTVKSPDPRYATIDVPLIANYILSSRPGKEAYVVPRVSGSEYSFTVRLGTPPKEARTGTKGASRGADFVCLLSGSVIRGDYIRQQASAGKIGQRLFAIVCEGPQGRLYLPPSSAHEQVAAAVPDSWKPTVEFCPDALGFRIGNYGMKTWADVYSPRQMLALNTFSFLAKEAGKEAETAARLRFSDNDDRPLCEGGAGARAYGEAIRLYLSLAVSRITHYWSSLSTWHNAGEKMQCVFARQAISMVWDFAECNVFSTSSGNWNGGVDWISEAVQFLKMPNAGHVFQRDAQTQTISREKIISTDPPYYDNIGYSDLSDFFYVWMRPLLADVFPDVFSTITTPKEGELVATPCRHGGNGAAEQYFLEGMTRTLDNIATISSDAFPITIFYAFKSSSTDSSGTSNTGWETFLEALIRGGLLVTGTWPMRTEMSSRARGRDSNALASSIVLVCRKRDGDAPETTRGAFLAELREAMPKALAEMKEGTDDASPVAPVDLAQAAIGPGMKVFSQYSAVRKADGSAMSVHEAIVEINKFVGDGNPGPDSATLFCQEWLAARGWAAGPFGDANTLAQAKGTTVDHVAAAGVLVSGGGKVRLLRPKEYPESYDPATDRNRPVWEACHHLVAAFDRGGSRAAGALLSKMPEVEEDVRDLCYSLYTLCERKGWAEDARAYNQLMAAWTSVQEAARAAAAANPTLKQGQLF